MKCPHCGVAVHTDWVVHPMQGHIKDLRWSYRSMSCPACKRPIIEVGPTKNGLTLWRLLHPAGASRGPVSQDVPKAIAADYIEACDVLPISPKASAALARRCLQAILHANGYHGKTLAHEIDALLAENDPLKAIPSTLRIVVDGIRNFGNFSAHPNYDKATLETLTLNRPKRNGA